MVLVFPGVEEVLAKDFLCNKVLIKEDFPTLERPAKTNSGFPVLGKVDFTPQT
jgi:hypothetical protein